MTLIGHIVGTKGNTGRGIASIVENADYTITINLTDGTSYTTAPIAGFTQIEFDENYDLVVTKTDGTTETVETDIEAFRTVLAGYKSDAETAESNASGYATAASGSASTATAKAKEAESYAKGGTSSRTGEDTDNADYYRGLAAASATAAGTSESNAGTQALKSEGYAVGKQNGTDVSSGSDYYHNNAKHYSDLASTAETNAETAETNASTSATNANADALKAEGYAVGKQNGTTVISGTYYHNNAMYYNSQATNMASLATNKANSAGTDALKAEGFSVGEQNGTPVTSDSPYYENNAKYYSEEAAASAASLTVDDELDGSSTNPVQNKVIKGELDSKANIDGYYESLGSGTADQLASNIYEEDSVPYNFRTSGGSIDIGDRETDMVVGGTVAWNQLVKQFVVNGSTISIDGTVVTVAHNGESRNFFGVGVSDGVTYTYKPLENHKYFWNVNVTSITVSNLRFFAFANGFSEQGAVIGFDTTGVHQGISKGVGNTTLYFNANTSEPTTSTADTFTFKDMMLIDLTQLFGSTIADYIYSLEQANTGAGVAWFKKLFPKPYYTYNAGELMSVNASSHDMVGFNAFDNSILVQTNSVRVDSDYIPVVPNTTYYFRQDSTIPGTYVTMHDANKNSLGNNISKYEITNFLFTTTADTHYITMGWFDSNGCPVSRIVNNNVNINLSWDGERDGEYEEYVKHSYPLDSDLTLRGIPKLDASNNLYYDGDTYESDGSVTRKWGYYTIQESDVTLDNAGGYTNIVCAKIENLPDMLKSTYKQAIHSRYGVGVRAWPFDDASNVSKFMVNPGNNAFWFGFAIGTTEAQMKSALAGTTVVYELATPTTETADPYTNPQIVDDFGTEEYVDYAVSQGDRDVAIPVGHETQYMANLKAKLEMSPNSPEGAGDYIVRQTNGENEYVSLASNATIQNIIARLEALEGGGE